MSRPPFSAESLAALDLDPAPIRPEWIIAGKPVARCRHWSDSSDGTTSAMVWDCTAGTFRWYFGGDEIVHIIEGEVMVAGEGVAARTLKPVMPHCSAPGHGRPGMCHIMSASTPSAATACRPS